ncbi:glycosyltransferase family 2 protein [Methylophaga sp. SB9B]|uniref:glycosyltransferase family 2 protein n=1 Tax=Methylophaga sp. SB9B TaxID=2570356 RepID=UPI0010A86F52|nr:glycosyltransferase family A protein [Methylophaga sp. SB9B]THK43290.1 glycosyltransferase family 2 protein [Methylophaga sp. SB9B]
MDKRTAKMIGNDEQQYGRPLLSVILPVYNGEKYLVEAIESVLLQTYTNFELIIINDASTDGSLKILESYLQRDSRIHVISRENRGLPATLNEAVENSQGKYIVRMDQDDICHPDRFLIQMEFLLNHSDVVAVGSAAIYIDQDGRMICTYFPDTEDKVLREKFPDSPFVHPSVMFSKEAFYNSGKYTEKMRWGGEDVTLFERMSRIGKLHNLNVPLIYYRLIPGSMSRKPAVFRNLLSKIIEDEIAGINVSEERLKELQLEAKK